MANRNNSGRTKKSHSYRPYDTSNSFVKRFTAKVSEILPQPTSWVSRLFFTSEKLNVRDREEIDEEEEDEEERQPPNKRLCFSSTEADYSHHNNINRLESDSGEISPIACSRIAPPKDDDQAVPGPSGLHLRHFPISSTPAIRPPPPISSAPIGLGGETSSRQQEERGRRQQGDDASDESESTSGCSSLVPGSRLRPEPPQAAIPSTGSLRRLSSSSGQKPNQSLNRTNLNLSSSSQPAFDTYIFNNPLNRSGLGKRLLGDESCFYSGNTTFGGSSARTLSPGPAETPRVVTVRPSPACQPQQDTIGSSALKILRALQQFSTPVMDAKRMPVRRSEVKKKPPQPYEELIFPSMPDLLRVKRRERELRTSERSDQSDSPTPSQQLSLPTTSSAPPLYAFRAETQKDKHVGSIKGRGKEKDFELERVPAVNLPNTVKLQINTLPKLDLAGSKKEEIPARQPSPLKSSQPYHFSHPQEPELPCSKARTLSLPSPLLFKFSEPLEPFKPKKKLESTDSSLLPGSEKSLPPPHQMKNPSPNFKLKRKIPESTFSFLLKPSETENPVIQEKSAEGTGSTHNSLCTLCTISQKCASCVKSQEKKESTSSSDIPWECLKCSAKLPSSEQKCKSCNLKRGEKPANTNAFKGFQGFTKPKDTWECKECLVQNKNTADVCAACSTPKAGKTDVIKNTFQFSSSKSSETKVNDTGAKTSFMFNSVKTSEGSWECNTCLVKNKKDDLKCVACSTDKPGATPAPASKPSFSFGIPTSSSSSQLKSTSLPNSDSKTTPPQFTFGIPADSTNVKSSFTPSFGAEKKISEHSTTTTTTNATVTSTVSSSASLFNSIKKAEGSWECSTCLVQNKKESTSCVACNTSKPGCTVVKLADKPKETFTFGIPAATPVSTTSTGTASSSSNSQPGFTFSSSTSVEKETAKTAPPVFSFNATSNSVNTTANEIKPFVFKNSDKTADNSKPPTSSNLFENNLEHNKAEEMNEDNDNKPAKKRVSFGNPLSSEKIVNNDGNTNMTFSTVVPSKPNESVSSSNFTFTPFDSNKVSVPSSNSFFSFGSSNTAETPKSNNLEPTKPLTFGGGDSAQPSLTSNNTFASLGGFKLPEPENKPFTFLANSQPAAPSGGFSFNSNSQTPKFGSLVNDGKPSLFFGQQQQQPAPSPTPAPAPLFSQPPQEQKPFVFNAPAQVLAQPVFSLNSSPAQPPSSGGLGGNQPGGFNFSDPNLKPTFNFTGGATPSFNAAPSAVVSERKMKRGIRRVTANR